MGVDITLTAELHSDNLSDGFSREEYFANGVRISKAEYNWFVENGMVKQPTRIYNKNITIHNLLIEDSL